VLKRKVLGIFSLSVQLLKSFGVVCEFLGVDIGSDYLSIASKWLHEKKNCDVNIISTVALRGIWLTRSDLIFHDQAWLDVKTVLKRMLRLTLEWSITFKDMIKLEMERWSSFLMRLIQEPLRIASKRRLCGGGGGGHNLS
jgi:hypothetical protein